MPAKYAPCVPPPAHLPKDPTGPPRPPSAAVFTCLLLASLQVALPQVAWAAGPTSEPKHARLQFSRRVLENGLTVLLAEEHSQPLVSVVSWYRSGARNEHPGITGIAHYLEHMAFRATRNIPAEDVTGRIERLGGHWHGYTRLDNTAYYETARREALEWLLFLEAERLQHSLILPQEVEVERGSVLSELKGYENDPWSLLFDDVAAVAFREHPYRFNIVGWISDLQAITHEDIVRFYRRHYVPANVILAVVGDFDTDKTWATVRNRFALLPAAPAPEPLRTHEPSQRGERRLRLELPGSSPHVLIAHRAPPFRDPDFFAFLLLDGVLSGGRSLSLLEGGFEIGALTAERRTSRLYREVIKSGIATRLSTDLLPSLHPYLYSISAEAAPGIDARRLEGAILSTLEGLAASPPSAEELAGVRERISKLMQLESDTYQEVVHVRATLEALGSADAWGRFEERLAAVSPRQVQSAARRYLAAQKRSVGHFIPQRQVSRSGSGSSSTSGESAGDAPAGIATSTESGGPAVSPSAATAKTEKKKSSSTPRGRVRVPEITLTDVPPPSPFRQRRLESGLVLSAAQNPWVSTAALAVEVDAGPFFDPERGAGIASLAARLLAFGSADRNAEQTAEAIDHLGMRWRVRVGGSDITYPDPRKVRIETEFAARDLERAMDLISGALREPSFEGSVFRNARQAQINAAAALRDDAVGLAWNGLWHATYGDSLWARALPVSGNEESLSNLSPSDLRRFHHRYYRPQRTRVAFCGGVPAPEALRLLQKAFAGWSPAPASEDQEAARQARSPDTFMRDGRLDRDPPPAPTARLDHKTQVQITYGFSTGVKQDSPDYPTFEALWYAVQHGYYAGRLGDRIVGQRGLAYSLESHHAPALPGSPMFMATGAPPEKVEELKRIWEETLDEIARDGITQEELKAALTYLQGRKLHERESNLSAARTELRASSHSDATASALTEITLQRVNELARRLLEDRRAIWSLAGPVG